MFVLVLTPFLVAATPAWKAHALASAAPFIDKANDEWSRAIVSGDTAELCAPYDPNGVFIGPSGTTVQGKAAVCDMYSKRPASVKVLKATIHSDGRVAADPNDVYEWGTAEMTVQRGANLKQASGRYLTVWHRAGNNWLITRNIAF
jgi:ketosteroid isomerase-like protein